MVEVRKEQTQLNLVTNIEKEPTGFTSPENINVAYDSITRKITLTGTVNGYYRGTQITVLISSWVSDAHPAGNGEYFLVYDGSSFSWIAPSAVDYSYLLIAFVNYGVTDKWAIRECHGVMSWESHKELHEVIGTYRISGGDIGDYTLNSTTVADRRPSVSATLIADEDLPTTNPLLAANGSYTQFYLSSTDTVNFDKTTVDIIPLSGNQPYYNEFTGGAWQQTLMSNNYYTSIWLVAIPITADSESQDYRYVWVQGQDESATLLAQQALNPNDLNFGQLQTLTPEFVVIGQIIIRYQGANWFYVDVRRIDGTRFSQTSSPQGSFLSSVTTDDTLTGDGTASNPLSVVREPFLSPVTSFLDFTTAEPGSPTTGDRYINTVTGTSSGTSQSVTANYIYEWNGASWDETIPNEGDNVYVDDEDKFYVYTGTAWVIYHRSLEQEQIYYIGKSGNDANSGLSDDDPVLTIQQAAALALAQTPSATNRFKLNVIDAGVYDLGNTVINVPSNVYINAPSATITSAGGALIFADNSGMVIGNIEKYGPGYIIQKTSGSGDAFVTILGNVDTGGNGWINLDNGSLHVNFRRAVSSGTANASFVQFVGGTLYLSGDYINSTASTGFALRGQGSAKLYANVKEIHATDEMLNLINTAEAHIVTKKTSGSIDVDSTAKHTVTINGHKLGDIDGFIVKYNNTTSVTITAGTCEANGRFYILTSDTTHTMTSLVGGFDFHYIYIDDSASTAPTATIIDSVIEPTYSASKGGWYNGDDRCIGVVPGKQISAEVVVFSACANGKIVTIEFAKNALPTMALNMNPDGTLQTPNQNNGSVVTPVNAKSLRFIIQGTDFISTVGLYMSNAEINSVTQNFNGYAQLQASGDIILGSSRNVLIQGDDNDDNALGLSTYGHAYER